MPTEELENELRGALARAAADIQDPEQAGQRLLGRDYRPGRGHRRLAAGAAATAAGAVALSLGLTGAFGSAPARGSGTIRTTAFTLVEQPNGTASLSINPNVLLEPSTLQSDLQQDGIPAMVHTGSFCSSEPTPAGFHQVVTVQRSVTVKRSPATLTINPAAIPVGTELSFGFFQLSQGLETAIGLVYTNSYTCTSTATAGALPGAGLAVVWNLVALPS